MKRLIALSIFMLVASSGFAQYFTLTTKGFVSKDQLDYVVINVPGVRQQDLYKNVLSVLSTMYKNPKEVLSTVDGESITITGYESKILPVKERVVVTQIVKSKSVYDVSYTMSILFKDGKMRVDRPSFECRRWYEGTYSSGWASVWIYLHLVKEGKAKYAIFDKNGNVIAQDAVDGLNKYFNSLTQQIADKSKKVSDW